MCNCAYVFESHKQSVSKMPKIDIFQQLNRNMSHKIHNIVLKNHDTCLWKVIPSCHHCYEQQFPGSHWSSASIILIAMYALLLARLPTSMYTLVKYNTTHCSDMFHRVPGSTLHWTAAVTSLPGTAGCCRAFFMSMSSGNNSRRGQLVPRVHET